MSHSAFSGNNAPGESGGISNSGDLTVSDSTFTDNSGGYGGGGISNSGDLTGSHSTFSGNRAEGYGGGISNVYGSVTVRDSTFTDNSLGYGGGGGIYSLWGFLTVSDSDYFCAPQVFYFRPHKLWYLVYQVGVPGRDKMWVAYSTTADIAVPGSWSKAKPMLDGGKDDPRQVGGLDYWIICDDQRAYLFLTSLDGRMWRLWTRLEDFPRGFGHCELAL